MARVLFVNAPVHNGDFTLATKPGKAVGIRIAAALNSLLGVGPVPHLWNTVTLAGDRRHTQHTEAGIQPSQLPALLKQFHRACLAVHSEPGPGYLSALREQIRVGNPTWVTRKIPLATAMRIASDG